MEFISVTLLCPKQGSHPPPLDFPGSLDQTLLMLLCLLCSAELPLWAAAPRSVTCAVRNVQDAGPNSISWHRNILIPVDCGWCPASWHLQLLRLQSFHLQSSSSFPSSHQILHLREYELPNERNFLISLASLYRSVFFWGPAPCLFKAQWKCLFKALCIPQWWNAAALYPLEQKHHLNGNFSCLYTFVASSIQSVLENPAPPPWKHWTKSLLHTSHKIKNKFIEPEAHLKTRRLFTP